MASVQPDPSYRAGGGACFATATLSQDQDWEIPVLV
jgi:hypothetical protein